MKFKSRKNIALVILMDGLAVGILCVSIYGFSLESFSIATVAVYVVISLVAALLVSITHGTYYSIKNGFVYYRSGPIFGKIAIHRIREIEKGVTQYVGLKPATDTNGLIIKYDKFDDIYISPYTNDTFIQELLKFKKDIIIVERR